MRAFYQLITSCSDYITFKKVKKARRRQAMGFAAGIIWSTLLIGSLNHPEQEHWLSRGPLTPGHEGLSCNSCHIEAEGTTRQQLQAKANFMLGFRQTDTDFGYQHVDNTKCLNCHNTREDKHSVFRFNEPRFAEVRQTLDATQCATCHTEHTGTVVSLPQTSFCSNCHSDLTLKNDPLEIPHEQLVGKALWMTCMQCHDYHGNHELTLATSIKDTIPVQAILNYVATGQNPYSTTKIHKASTTHGK